MEQGERVRQRRRVGVVLTVVLVGLGAVATWWFTAAHPGTHLARAGDVTMCADSANGTELVMGGLEFSPPADATVLAVRLVDPQNVELADARVVPLVSDEGSGSLIFGLTAGWPVEDAAEYTVDWTADRDLVGAHLRPGVAEAPYLHLRVLDPDQPASFGSWQVEYRLRATTWVSRFTIGFTRPAGPAGCDAV